MDLSPALARYAHALGRWQAARRFAPLELRRAAALAQVSAAWDVFRRDAGPGPVGRAHEDAVGRTAVTCTDDPRRDGVLLWLVDHGAPPIAEAAGLLAHMVRARRRFSAEGQELLQAARDALGGNACLSPLTRLLPAPAKGSDDPLVPLRTIAAAVDQLRADGAFLESGGSEVRHRLPRGSVSHYVPAEPGATWAFNLALLTRGPWLQKAPPVAALVSRMLFRPGAEPEELAVALVDGATTALRTAFARLDTLSAELKRGSAALAHMSSNSRTRETWSLLAALRSSTRSQLGRGLGLSRAGADLQVRALADIGLAALSIGGRVDWLPEERAKRASPPLSDGSLCDAAASLDATMADIDRLLAGIDRRA